jgi:RNA polymerase sigma factor (TIGR02999 family)
VELSAARQEPLIDPVSEAEINLLMPAVYEELKRAARHTRRRLSAPKTLSTTALVHETYLKLAHNKSFQSKSHFLRVAAVAMRRAVIDSIRAATTTKRGGGVDELTLDEDSDFVVEDAQTVMRVHDSLESLKTVNPRLVSIVECLFFAGYSEAETAEALGISERTVRRDWVIARAWLKKELSA